MRYREFDYNKVLKVNNNKDAAKKLASKNWKLNSIDKNTITMSKRNATVELSYGQGFLEIRK